MAQRAATCIEPDWCQSRGWGDVGAVMGTPVPPSPYTGLDTLCTHVCTGRDDVSSLGKAEPFPKLGSGLLRLFCSFSINIKSNYLDFFFFY